MKKIQWIVYTVYGILVTVVFLYALFPSEAVRNTIMELVKNTEPGIALSIGAVNPGFPPSVTCKKVVFHATGRPDGTVEANVVTARPSLRNFFEDRALFSIHADLYGGNLRASADFTSGFAPDEPTAVDIALHNINIGGCSLLRAELGRRVDGHFTGSGTFKGTLARPLDGTASAAVVLRDGSIELLKNVFGFDVLTFDRIEMHISLKKRTVTVNTFKLKGDLISGSLAGTVFLHPEFTESRLDLKGTVEVPALNRTFSTSIQGTVANPIPQFM